MLKRSRSAHAVAAAVPKQEATHVGPQGSTDPAANASRICPRRRESLKLCLIVAVMLLASLGNPATPAAADPYAIPLNAIGRVLDEEKQFKCTGFIIASVNRRVAAPVARYYESAPGWYENTLISAGHCLEHVKYFSANGKTHAVQAIVGYSDHKHGYDILVARFSTAAAMPALEPAYRYEPHPGESFMLVGFGRTALQVNVNPFVGYNDRGDLIVDGISGPGDSGSPVLLPGTRKVVGILHSGTVDVPDEGRNNPYFCMFQSCPSTRPYYATPIDRIQGLARW